MDVAGRLEATEQPREKRGPSRVRELQRHTREGKAHEADDHDDVENPIQSLESEKLILSRRWRRIRSGRLFHALLRLLVSFSQSPCADRVAS